MDFVITSICIFLTYAMIKWDKEVITRFAYKFFLKKCKTSSSSFHCKLITLKGCSLEF